MKKLLQISVVLLLFFSLLSFVACQDADDNNDEELKEVVLLIVDKEHNELARYERESSGYLSDLLLSLTQEEDSAFSYDSTVSAYGQFVNSITVETDPETFAPIGLFPDSSENEFVALYHTIDTVKERDYSYDFEFNDKTYYGAANNVDKTPLVDGAEYLFTISTWS
ncbi:MAG: hypothetical protein ACOCWI_02530 [Bacillota bacterium]